MTRTRFFVALLCVLTMVWASAHAGTEEKAVAKAREYLMKNQHSSGGWPLVVGEGDPEAETTTWAVRALILTDGDRKAIEKAVQHVLKARKESGSLNDNTAHTAFLVMALDTAKVNKAEIARSVDWLLKNQHPDGGWGQSAKGPSLSLYTAVALKALALAGKKADDPAVKKALDYLRSIQNPDGGWPIPKGGKSLALGTAWVLNALADFNIAKGDPGVDKGLAFLMKCRKQYNGGFSIVAPAPEDPEITAYAMLALAAQKAHPEAVEDAAFYLSAVQLPDGAFISNTPMEFKKKRKKNVQTTCFVIWALKAAGH